MLKNSYSNSGYADVRDSTTRALISCTKIAACIIECRENVEKMVETSKRAVQKFVTGIRNLERDAFHAEIASRYKYMPYS